MTRCRRTNSWRAVDHPNQHSLLLLCVLLVTGGCSPFRASQIPGSTLPVDIPATLPLLPSLGGTPASGPLSSTGLRRCPDSCLEGDGGMWGVGRFKYERGHPFTSLPKNWNDSSTLFNAKSQDQASLTPSKAELLPKFSPEKCLLSPNPSTPISATLHTRTMLFPPILWGQSG